MRRIGSGLHRFWQKAYTDNLTGLAAMVAYNLLLSVFPVALIALFVAGQVLSSRPSSSGRSSPTCSSSSPPPPTRR